jgi:DNA ligase-1
MEGLMSIKKPMLAASMENSKGEEMTFKDLTYPLGASIKLDGIRCLRVDGQTLSRSFKQIPNKYIQAQMANLIDGLDGELITYNDDGTCRTFNQVQGDVMREDGEPNFKFEIFDYVKDSLDKQYIKRILDLKALTLPSFCKLVLPTIINNEAELLAFEEQAIADGHEGIMTRHLGGSYKCGRATFKSQDLIKIKRFVDSEAIILGFEEKLNNENEATKDELGHTKRSSAKAGLVPAGTLGTLLVRDIKDGREFGIGTYKGLKKEDLQEIWDNRDQYLGKIVKYQYQLVGTKDLPRIPSFQGFRDPRDMS